MIPLWLLLASKAGQAESNNVNQLNAQQKNIVTGQSFSQNTPQNNSGFGGNFTSVYSSIFDRDDEDELEKKKKLMNPTV